jgi:hypothetical protein
MSKGRASKVCGGAKARDFARSGTTGCDHQRGLPTAWLGGFGVLPVAGGRHRDRAHVDREMRQAMAFDEDPQNRQA